MDDKALERLLRVSDPLPGRPGWGCLDAAQVSAYVEHRVSAEEETTIEAHLADCTVCREHVVFLARRRPDDDAPVAPQLLARARALVATKPRAWQPLVLRWGSVAAALVLFTVVGFRSWQPGAPLAPSVAEPDSAPAAAPAAPPQAMAPAAQPAPRSVPSAPPGARSAAPVSPAPPPASVRKSPVAPTALVLSSPAENSTVALPGLEFRWHDTPNAIYYELHVVTEEGDVVWQGKVEGTHARLPEGYALQAGAKYFVWVRAHLAGGGTVKSAAVPFRVGGS